MYPFGHPSLSTVVGRLIIPLIKQNVSVVSHADEPKPTGPEATKAVPAVPCHFCLMQVDKSQQGLRQLKLCQLCRVTRGSCAFESFCGASCGVSLVSDADEPKPPAAATTEAVPAVPCHLCLMQVNRSQLRLSKLRLCQLCRVTCV